MEEDVGPGGPGVDRAVPQRLQDRDRPWEDVLRLQVRPHHRLPAEEEQPDRRELRPDALPGPDQGAPGRRDGHVEGVEAGNLGLPFRPVGQILLVLGQAGGAPEHLKRHGGAPPGGAGR